MTLLNGMWCNHWKRKMQHMLYFITVYMAAVQHTGVLGCANCNLLLRDLSGKVTSPCYPDLYPNSQDCNWTIISPVGFIIRVTFLDFDIEEAQNCMYDYVSIYNGETTSKFCGTTAKDLTFNSTGNEMTIGFVSDFSIQKKGFKAIYTQHTLNETSGHSGQYCVEQPARTESIEGKSVTIPCQFSFPESENSIKAATIIVRASDQNYCEGNNTIIYNTSRGLFSPKYQGRLNVTFNLRHKNASIAINNVMKEDATHYCCHLELSFPNRDNQKWGSRGGTRLTVKDRNDPGLETIPVIFAAPGENVTLLGHFTSNNIKSASDVTCHVWRTPDRYTGCDRGTNIGECTYKNNSLYFQINQVTSEDNAFYCYQVNISTNNEEKNTYYYLGPQLLIIGKTSTLNIIQPEKVEFHQPVTINCSFTLQQNNDVLRTEVYWIFGDTRESYVYHPNLNYIHTDYRGKTRLVDGSNLQLEDFHGPDNTTFYCRVIFRQCFGEGESQNRIDTILEEGPGTRLIVKGSTLRPTGDTILTILAAYVGLKAFLILILSILAAIYVNKNY
ncbi:adhesion G-protein coupled receptor G6-like isoform X3 [Aquarana catesbeiana]